QARSSGPSRIGATAGQSTPTSEQRPGQLRQHREAAQDASDAYEKAVNIGLSGGPWACGTRARKVQHACEMRSASWSEARARLRPPPLRVPSPANSRPRVGPRISLLTIADRSATP